MLQPLLLGAVLTATLLLPSMSAASRDGHLFDHGAAMDAPSERASEATHRVAPLAGQWDVTWTFFSDGEPREAAALAAITWMNRGHGLLERVHCDDFDGPGQERATVVFLTHTPNTDVWNLSLADSWTENITLLHGGFRGDDLVFATTIRRGGSSSLTHYRWTLSGIGGDGFTLRAEQAVHDGDYRPMWTRDYSRRAEAEDFLLSDSHFGQAAPDLPAEAGQFDFLRGEWDEVHHMVFPNGQEATWGVNGTAVRALDGHAIMEHAWYDVDPNVPDAATTILRVYNRAMRRWECMYTTNRANGILYFGGAQEGDQIVLHGFGTDTSVSPLNLWVFHDIADGAYGWFGQRSTDRGKTFQKTWEITATRRVAP